MQSVAKSVSEKDLYTPVIGTYTNTYSNWEHLLPHRARRDTRELNHPLRSIHGKNRDAVSSHQRQFRTAIRSPQKSASGRELRRGFGAKR